DIEIVLALEHTRYGFARRQNNGDLLVVPLCGRSETSYRCGIKKGGLQIRGLVLAGDVRQIARRRVAHFAAASAVEISFACLRVTRHYVLHFVSAAIRREIDTHVQEFGEVIELR